MLNLNKHSLDQLPLPLAARALGEHRAESYIQGMMADTSEPHFLQAYLAFLHSGNVGLIKEQYQALIGWFGWLSDDEWNEAIPLFHQMVTLAVAINRWPMEVHLQEQWYERLNTLKQQTHPIMVDAINANLTDKGWSRLMAYDFRSHRATPDYTWYGSALNLRFTFPDVQTAPAPDGEPTYAWAANVTPISSCCLAPFSLKVDDTVEDSVQTNTGPIAHLNALLSMIPVCSTCSSAFGQAQPFRAFPYLETLSQGEVKDQKGWDRYKTRLEVDEYYEPLLLWRPTGLTDLQEILGRLWPAFYSSHDPMALLLSGSALVEEEAGVIVQALHQFSTEYRNALLDRYDK